MTARSVWAVALPPNASTPPALLARLRAAGINALVIRQGEWTARNSARLERQASAAGIGVVETRRPPRTKAQLAELRAQCGSRRTLKDGCAVEVPTVSEAGSWLRRGRVGFVVLTLRTPAGFTRVRETSTRNTRLVGLVRLSRGARIDRSWQSAVANARSSRNVALGVSAEAPATSAALRDYLQLLEPREGFRTTEGDRQSPTAPTNLRLAENGLDFITVAWDASTDNVGVVRYELYLDGHSKGTTSNLYFRFTELRCGTTFRVDVEAQDAAGNVSARARIDAQTMYGCAKPGNGNGNGNGNGGGNGSGGSGGPKADTDPPSVPSGLEQTSATATSVALGWAASSDNVRVAGYGVYVGSIRIGTTASPGYVVGGLTCGGTFAVGVDAYDAAGNRSARATFVATTAACGSSDTQPPTVPADLATTSSSADSISLSWTAATDDTGVTEYGVYRDGSPAGSSTSADFTVRGLACGSSYSIEVDAADAAGNRSARAAINASTSECPAGSPPSAPSGLAASNVSRSSITLSWSPSTDDKGVAGYGRYLNGMLLSNGSETSFTFSDLSCGTTHSLEVDAYDADGNRSARTSLSVGTSACADTTPPTVPSNLAATGATATSVSLSWTASSDNVGVTGYRVLVDGAAAGTTAGTSFTASGFRCGSAYVVAVDASDAAGNRSSQASVTVSTSACPVADTQPPTVPQGQQIAARTDTSLTMVWNASTDNVGVVGYRVYLNDTLVASTPSLTHTYTGLRCGTTYTVALEAYDAAGNASNRALAQGPATTAACPGDSQPPTAPAGLTQTAGTGTSATLGWSASSDNVGVAGYGVYVNGTRIATTASTSYVLSALSCGVTYSVAVDAYDAAGNRSSQSSATARTNVCADTTSPTVPTNLAVTGSTATSVSLSWTASSDNVGVTSYRVLVNGAQAGTTAGTSFTASGLSCGSAYIVAVDASDAAGNRSGQASVTVSTSACADSQPPSVPQGQRISASTGSTITMVWNGSTDNVGVAGYRIYLNGGVVGTTTSLTYVYTGLSCGTTYTVGLEAYDAAGNVSNRAQAEGPATTAACAGDTQPPTTPPSLVVTGTTAASISLGWGASLDNVGVTEYRVLVDGIAAGTTAGRSYTATGLRCGTAYLVAVDASDAAGNRSGQASLTVSTAACPVADTQPPSVPQGQQISARTETTLTMVWNPSTDNVAVAGYRLYLDGALAASTPALTYTFTGLRCGTTYTVALEAYDAAGNASNRALAQGPATTAPCAGDTQPPTAPTGLVGTGSTQTSISLGWGASVDNVGVAGYGVYRGTTAVGSTSSLLYTVTGLSCGTSYALAVDAYDAAGNRSAKASITASTAACSSGSPGSGSANVWWDADGGTCTRSPVPVAYNDAAACAIPARTSPEGNSLLGWTTAQNGDTVGLYDEPGGNDYGVMTLSPTAKSVALVGMGGEGNRPEFSQIRIGASNVTLRNVKVESRPPSSNADQDWVCGGPPHYAYIDPAMIRLCGDNVTIESFEVDGLRNAGSSGDCPDDGIDFWDGDGSNPTGIVIRNGSLHGVWDAKGMNINGRYTLENVHFYDNRLRNNCAADVHNECIYTPEAANSVIRGNLFQECPVFALYFSGGPDTDSDNVTIENNVFGHTMDSADTWHAAPCALKVGAGPSRINGWVVRYNTFETSPCLDNLPRGTTPGQWYGNIGGATCIAGFVYSWNVGEICSGANSLATSPAVNIESSPNRVPWYVNASGFNFHLTSGSAPIGRGNPSAFPSIDLDGGARSSPPDAGADEFGA